MNVSVGLSIILFWVLIGNAIGQAEITLTAQRTVDIASQVVKVIINYEITNVGKDDVNNFIHLSDKDESTNIAFITAAEGKKGAKLKIMKTAEKAIKSSDFVPFKVELLDALKKNEKTTVTVEYHLTHFLKPFPEKISQSDAQLVQYSGNAHVASAYPMNTEITSFILPIGKLESYTSVKPTKQESGKIVYGPYTNVEPFKLEKMKIHAENNSPFLVATYVERLIEISHWGNIAVEEKIDLVHRGAELVGPFSRLDFQLDRRGTKRPVVTNFKTLLPATAKDIYYRDEIGNISTSSVRKIVDAVEVTIQPRFPLFGGWKTDYILGYNIPAYQYLYSEGNSFALKMRVIDHLFDNSVIERLKLKILLPEMSVVSNLITPFSVKRLPNEVFATYLDITGRPMIVIEIENLVDAHSQFFTLYYEFNRMLYWREPLIASAAFAALFLIVIICVRLDFTIVSDPSLENRLQVQGQIEQVTELHADRLKIYDVFTDAANKLRNNRDNIAFTTMRKKAESDLKTVTQSITDLQNEIRANSVEISEKLNEAFKYHKAAVETITNYLAQVERLTKGQMSKAAVAEAEKSYHQKLNELKEKMDNIIYAL